MKRKYFILMLSLMMFITLSGCSENHNSEKSDLSDFDSFICFSAGNVTDSELDEIAHILESRVTSSDPMPEYQIMTEYGTDTVRIDFNYIEK